MKKFVLLFFGIALASMMFAQNVAYYNSVNLSQTGTALQNELANLITTTHTNIISYTTAYQLIKSADEDANNTNNVILIYNGVSDPKTNSVGGGGSGTQSTGWNREHVFAQSLASPSLGTSGAGADAHNLRACNASINSGRGNKRFEAGSGNYGSVSTTGYYPGDDWRGDVARIIFYMNTRYGTQCPIANISTINLLLQWNVDDPVSPFEDQRNDVIYATQGNRNPFIDNPIFATNIWGGPTAEDRLSGAVANPANFVATPSLNSVSFSATANTDGDQILLAFVTGTPAFGTPTGTYSVGNIISGGGEVLYVGAAAGIPDHIGLTTSTQYSYKIWSYNSPTTNYSNGATTTVTTQSTPVASASSYYQGFENTAQDNWTYTPNPASYTATGDVWAIVSSLSSITPTAGSSMWGIQDITNPIASGVHTLAMATVDVSTLTNAEIEFDYNVIGFDTGDWMRYQVFFDGNAQGVVNLLTGGVGGISTSGWETETITIPPGTNQVSLQLTANQDGGTDYAAWDNIQINGTTIGTVQNPSLLATAISPTGIAPTITPNTDNDQILLAIANGPAGTFGTPTGTYLAGDNISGGGQVIYVGDAANAPDITCLASGATYSLKAFSFDGADYSSGVTADVTLQLVGAEVTLFCQSFDATANTWAYTTNPLAYNLASNTDLWTERTSVLTISPLTGTGLWAMRDLVNPNGGGSFEHILEFSNVSTAGNTSKKIIINYNVIEFETNDYLRYEAFFDNVSQGKLSLFTAPASNSSTNGWEVLEINVPDGVDLVSLRLYAFQDGAGDYAAFDDICITSVANDIVWDGCDWVDGIEPNATTNANKKVVIYPGEPAEIAAEAICSALEILADANLNILDVASLTVNGSVVNNGNLILLATSTGQGIYIGESTNLTFTYHLNRAGWHYMASPVAGTTLGDLVFENDGLLTYPGIGETALNCTTCNVKRYETTVADNVNIGSNSSNAYGSWIGAADDAEAFAADGTSWNMYFGAGGFGTLPVLMSISGPSAATDVVATADDANEGWNLLGNPYPATVNWTAKTDVATEGFDNAYWIWNGSAFASYINGVGVNGANGLIAPGEGFFVHSATPISGPSASTNARNFTFTEAMRTTDNTVRTKQEYLGDLVKIRFESGDLSDEIALLFDNSYAENFHPKEDALKMPLDEKDVPTISMITDDYRTVAINALPMVKDRKSIDLQTSGAMFTKVALVHSDINERIYLLGNNKQLIALQPQMTTLPTGFVPKQIVISEKQLTEKDIPGYTYAKVENGLEITALSPIESIALYDQVGRLLYYAKPNQEVHFVPVASQPQFYILHIQTSEGVFVEKLVH